MREIVRDKGRLEHILSAINQVETFVGSLDYDSFVADILHLHATVYNVQIIGEAVYRLTNEFKSAHSEIPWRMIEKMRHILVHDYYQINLEILWAVIKEDIPDLKTNVMNYLSEIEESSSDEANSSDE